MKTNAEKFAAGRENKEMIVIYLFFVSLVICLALIVAYEFCCATGSRQAALTAKLGACTALMCATCAAIGRGGWTVYAGLMVISQLLFIFCSLLVTLRSTYPEHDLFYSKLISSAFLLWLVALAAAIMSISDTDSVSLTISAVVALLFLATALLITGFFKVDAGKMRPALLIASALGGFDFALSARFAFGETKIAAAAVIFVGMAVFLAAAISYLYSVFGRHKTAFPFFMFGSAAFFAAQLILSVSVMLTGVTV